MYEYEKTNKVPHFKSLLKKEHTHHLSSELLIPSSLNILGTFLVINRLYASWLSRIIADSGRLAARRPARRLFAGPGCGLGTGNKVNIILSIYCVVNIISIYYYHYIIISL